MGDSAYEVWFGDISTYLIVPDKGYDSYHCVLHIDNMSNASHRHLYKPYGGWSSKNHDLPKEYKP